MNSPQFRLAAQKSLDSDLFNMVQTAQADAVEAILLQLLRIARGKPHEINERPTEAWSPDGKTWYDKAPGNGPMREII